MALWTSETWTERNLLRWKKREKGIGYKKGCRAARPSCLQKEGKDQPTCKHLPKLRGKDWYIKTLQDTWKSAYVCKKKDKGATYLHRFKRGCIRKGRATKPCSISCNYIHMNKRFSLALSYPTCRKKSLRRKLEMSLSFSTWLYGCEPKQPKSTYKPMSERILHPSKLIWSDNSYTTW